jgi:2-phosphosulfolactate phosphatase
MRVHVALTPEEFPDLALGGRAALVVDVLRATSMVIAAFDAGCARVIPVAGAAEARERARALAPEPVLLAGERGGEQIDGFDLGNSPLDCTPERVGGRSILLTTTNGTAAMLKASQADAAAVAALTNVGAAVRWAVSEGRDLTVLCAGEKGGFSLEDAVCAGLLAEGIGRAAAGATLSGAAQAARCLGILYGARLDRLRRDSGWARHLDARRRGADLDCCLRLDVSAVVPVLADGAIVAGPGVLTWPAGAADTRLGRSASPGANR